MPGSRGTRTLGGITTSVLLDAAGRRRSPATLPGNHCGRGAAQQGPALPGGSADGRGDRRRDALRRRDGVRPSCPRAHRPAVARRRAHQARRSRSPKRPRPRDRRSRRAQRQRRQALRARHGPLGLADEPWLDYRIALPVGALLCVIDGPTAGRACSLSAARTLLCRLALIAGASHRISVAMCARSSWRHSAPVRARQPRDHVDLTPGPRQQRDHQHRLGPPGADAARQRWLR